MYKNRILGIFIIALIISGNCTASDNTFYVSPGLRIGWDFGRGPTISLKLSLGINTNYNFDDNTKYYNITFGFKAPLFRKAKYNYEDYEFIELQAGFTPFFENLLFLGGGIGFIYYKNGNKTKYHPIITIDCGCFIFAACDFLILEDKKISTDFGFLVVAPIPWKKGEFGLN